MMDLGPIALPRRKLEAEFERLRKENLTLWARDHARGHRPTPDCPVCVKFLRAAHPEAERAPEDKP